MKTIINFTPTGMIPTKTMTPYVPVSTTEIILNPGNGLYGRHDGKRKAH